MAFEFEHGNHPVQTSAIKEVGHATLTLTKFNSRKGLTLQKQNSEGQPSDPNHQKTGGGGGGAFQVIHMTHTFNCEEDHLRQIGVSRFTPNLRDGEEQESGNCDSDIEETKLAPLQSHQDILRKIGLDEQAPRQNVSQMLNKV